MEKLKTFQEIIDETPLLYTGTDVANDTATQSVILDWFQYRRVVSNTKFATYFRRVLNRDYSRYVQLLRIEPGKEGDSGITNYDWLVTNYAESLTTSTGNTDNVKSGTIDESFNKGNTKTISNGGTDVTVNSGSNASDYSTNNSYNTTGTINSHSDSDSSAGNTAQVRTGVAAKNTPMSQSYDDGLETPDATKSKTMREYAKARGFVNKDSDGNITAGIRNRKSGSGYDPDYWDENSADGSIRALGQHFPDLYLDKPSSVSDTFSTNSAVSESAAKENSLSATSDNGTSTEGGYNSSTSENTNVTNYGHTVTESYSGSGDKKANNYTEVENGNNTNVNKHIHTGRDGIDTATILSNVISFIDSSSAWDWFRGQLETCFMAVIDEED